jgi:multidrug efflux pump subunit AcrA (membrane-fusion protein)
VSFFAHFSRSVGRKMGKAVLVLEENVMDRMRRRQICLIVVSCLILLSVGCNRQVAPAATTAPAGASSSLEHTVVQRGRVVKTLSFDGRVTPVKEVPVFSKTSGYVKHVYFKQGDRVQAGDLLAELETSDLLAQSAQAQSTLDLAKQRLAAEQASAQQEITLAKLDLEIARAKLTQAQESNADAIAQARLSLELARERLARAKALGPVYTVAITGALVGVERAQDARDRAQGLALEMQLAQWNLDAAQAEYDQALAEQNVYWHDLNIQDIAVKQAAADLERLEKGIDPWLNLQVQQAELVLERLETDIDPVLASNVQRAQLALEQLNSQLENVQILAPIDGELISLSIRPGDSIEPLTPIIAIADPKAVEIGASLSDEELRPLAEGQQVTVTLSAVPDRTWLGTIRCLPYPHGTCGSTAEATESNRAVRVSIDDGASDMQVGAAVQMVAVLEDRPNVLWLPPALIRTFQDRNFVIVKDGDGQRRVDIELGTESHDRVEIAKGLQEGQAIVAP